MGIYLGVASCTIYLRSHSKTTSISYYAFNMVLGFLKQVFAPGEFSISVGSTDLDIWRVEKPLDQLEYIAGEGGPSFLKHHALVIRGGWYHLLKHKDGSLRLDRRPFPKVDKASMMHVGLLDESFSSLEIENIGALFSALICTHNNDLLWL
jgi:hypothetical protein